MITTRTVKKFARDFAVAVIAYALLWLEQNISGLDLVPATSGIAVAILLLGHRMIRDVRGVGPGGGV